MARQSRKLGNGADCHLEVVAVELEPDAVVIQRHSGGKGGTCAHERVEDNSLSQRERCPNDLPHESLWLERRVGGDLPLLLTGRRRRDDIAKRALCGSATKPSGPPLSQVVLDPSFTGFAEQAPRLPLGSRHDRDILKSFMGVLGTVSAPERLDEPDDLPALFETRLHQRQIHKMGKQWIGGNEEVSARDQNPEGPLRKLREKALELPLLRSRQYGESGEGASLATVVGRRDPPDSAPSPAQLLFLWRGVFLETVGRVRHNGVDRSGLPAVHPCEAIAPMEVGICSFGLESNPLKHGGLADLLRK